MSASLPRTFAGMSTQMSVVISPATTTRPVVISVSQATRPFGSSASTASRTVSEIWSATLSGCPSVTDSEVKRKSRTKRRRLLDLEEDVEGARVPRAGAPREERAQRCEVRGPLLRRGDAAEPDQALDHRVRVLEVHVDEAAVRIGQSGRRLRALEVRVVGELVAGRLVLGDGGRARRDEHLSFRGAVVDGDPRDLDALHRDASLLRGRARLGEAHGAEPREQLAERPERLLLVRRLEYERELRQRRPRPGVEGDLVAEEVEDVLERDAEVRLELLERRPELRVVLERLQLVRDAAALEGEERERVARDAAHQLRRVVAASEHLRAGAGDGAVQPDAVVLRAQRGGDGVELVDPERGEVERRAALLDGLAEQGRELRAVDVGLGERVRRQLPHSVVERAVVGERAVAALEDAIDHLLAARERVPAVADLAVNRLVARAAALVQLRDELLELRGVVGLRQKRERGLLQRRPPHDGDVDLGTERGLDVGAVVDVLPRERVLDLRERLRPARELVRELVDLLPLARAEVAVDRDKDERVGTDELRAGLRRESPFVAPASAAAGRDEGECDEEAEKSAGGAQGHSRVGSRPIKLAANSFKSVPSSTLQ